MGRRMRGEGPKIPVTAGNIVERDKLRRASSRVSLFHTITVSLGGRTSWNITNCMNCKSSDLFDTEISMQVGVVSSNSLWVKAVPVRSQSL
jgi:hypothetical protein